MDDVPGLFHGPGDDFSIADGLLDQIEVAASRERGAGASDHSHLNFVVLAQIQPDQAQFVVQFEVSGVVDFGTVDGHQGDAVFDLDDQMFVVAVVVHRTSSELSAIRE